MRTRREARKSRVAKGKQHTQGVRNRKKKEKLENETEVEKVQRWEPLWKGQKPGVEGQ